MTSHSKCEQALMEIYEICLYSRDDAALEIEEIIEGVLDLEVCNNMRAERIARIKAALARDKAEYEREVTEFTRALMEGGSLDEYGNQIERGREQAESAEGDA